MVLGTSGLRFTKAGAVESPQVLQIRVTQSFRGRLVAGAPAPRRGLTHSECVANLRYFSEGLRGPRTLPCTGLVVSGADWRGTSFNRNTLMEARALGYERITVHAAMDTAEHVVESDLNGMFDALGVASHERVDVMAIRHLEHLRDPNGNRPHISVVKSLNHEGLAALEDDVTQFIEAGIDRLVLTWPLVAKEVPPHVQSILERLDGVIRACDVAQIPVGLKGFPLCVLGEYSSRAWRSKNRYYVDAGHQLENALLFFPDIIQLQKLDRCRQCIVSHQCDGIPPQWLALGLTGPIEPVE